MAQRSLGGLTPGRSVLEHAEPGRRGHRGAEGSGHPCPLPAQCSTLRVGHHGQVTPVGRADPGHALWRAIGVQGVFLSGATRVVHIAQGGERAINHLLTSLIGAELHQSWVRHRPCQQNIREDTIKRTPPAHFSLVTMPTINLKM